MGSHSYYVDNVGLLVRTTVVDDFERDDLPVGEDANGIGVGFVTWNHPAASVGLELTDAPPAPVPGGADGNPVLAETLTIGSGQWAGFTHAFSQRDRRCLGSARTGRATKASASGSTATTPAACCFIEFSENRNPGSTSDDAERWSWKSPTTSTGWQFFTIPFDDFNRKEIGNGAPNDGFTLDEVYGYSVGAFGSVDMGTNTYYVDDVTLYGKVGDADKPLEIEFADISYTVVEGDSVDVTVSPEQGRHRNRHRRLSLGREHGCARSRLHARRRDAELSRRARPKPRSASPPSTTASTTATAPSMLNLSNPVNADLGFSIRAHGHHRGRRSRRSGPDRRLRGLAALHRCRRCEPVRDRTDGRG